eukprot:283337-Chlamydomonas_euryale.AAC.9
MAKHAFMTAGRGVACMRGLSPCMRAFKGITGPACRACCAVPWAHAAACMRGCRPADRPTDPSPPPAHLGHAVSTDCGGGVSPRAQQDAQRKGVRVAWVRASVRDALPCVQGEARVARQTGGRDATRLEKRGRGRRAT